MFRPSTMLRTVLASAALLAAGCGDGSAPAGTTRLDVRIKDAPGDFVAAVVTVDRVSLVGESGTLVLTDQPQTVSLLDLTNDTQLLVDDAIVPSGTYSELRYRISGGYIEVENADGTTSIYASSPTYAGLPAGATVAGELQMPSLGQSGLKVKLDGDQLVVEGDQKIVLVDFDVSQSFGKQAGNSGRWVMRPVVRGGDITVTGSIRTTVRFAEGYTLPAPPAGVTAVTLADFPVTLTNAEGGVTEIATTANGDGTRGVTIRYVAPGAYTLGLKLPTQVQSATVVSAPTTVNVASSTESTVTLTLSNVVYKPAP